MVGASAPGWAGEGADETDAPLRPGQEVIGQIRDLDAVLRTVTLADGTAYAIDEQFNMGGFAVGEWVRLTAGPHGIIREMAPQPAQ